MGHFPSRDSWARPSCVKDLWIWVCGNFKSCFSHLKLWDQVLEKEGWQKTDSSILLSIQLEIKNHVFFSPINWDDLYHKRITPPFNPNVVSGCNSVLPKGFSPDASRWHGGL